MNNVRYVRPRTDIISEGDRPTHVNLMLRGWACRYKVMEDGRRQIVSFFVPGDFCDLNVYILKEMDHGIGAITNVRIAQIVPADMERVTHAHPRVTQALWWHELVNVSVQREWTLNLGARSAYERIAHLFAETFLRLHCIGLTQGDSCDFPLTQVDLADASGLTPVHVNRTLQELRREGLIELDRQRLRIPDLERLKRVAMFTPNYLHMNHEGSYLDAND